MNKDTNLLLGRILKLEFKPDKSVISAKAFIDGDHFISQFNSKLDHNGNIKMILSDDLDKVLMGLSKQLEVYWYIQSYGPKYIFFNTCIEQVILDKNGLANTHEAWYPTGTDCRDYSLEKYLEMYEVNTKNK